MSRSASRVSRFPFRIDPGFLIVLAICLLVLWPFIGRASLPQETDAELHIFRLLELSSLVRGGEFYPRWAPDFYHGYGYPIFNYYAPLTYYVGLLFDFLPGMDAVAGVKAVFVLGWLGAGFGMYGFVRDNWGRPAGYVATAVYLYAPYVQYIDPIARGALAESFSLGVFPLALWALDRLRRQATAVRWITAVFLIAALILSHNLMALLFFSILFAWAIWQVVSRGWRVANGRLLFSALFLGVGLSAFFWLPVALERNAVNLNTLIGAGDNYDFRTHFLSWREMLAPTRWLDWGATEPVFTFNLGVAQWVLGGLGLVLLLMGRVRHRAQAAFFAVALAVLLFLMLPISTFLWEAIPLLPFFQFPWRLMGGVAVMLAVLAGAGLDALLTRCPSVKVQGGVTAVFVAIPLLFALPLTQPVPWPDFGEVFMLRMSLIEHSGRWLGTTSTADYVPETVDMMPERNGNVVYGFTAGTPIDRVNYRALPDGTDVEWDELSPLHFRYEVDAPEDLMFRLFLFDFPGWTVRVDGEIVETELGLPEGFIVVPLLAGQHVVDVRFQDIPARTLAWAISGLALLTMLVVAVWIRGLGRQTSQFTIHNSQFTIPDWLALGTVLGITAVTLLILEPTGILHYHSQNYIAEPAQHQLLANFDDQIALIGYDASPETVRPGDTLNIDLYWQAQRPLDINYQNFLHILTPEGVLVAQSDHLNPGEFPTRRWPMDKYVRDEHVVVLPEDLPAGEYLVKVGLWVQSEGWRLPLFDESGQQIDDGQVLYRFSID